MNILVVNQMQIITGNLNNQKAKYPHHQQNIQKIKCQFKIEQIEDLVWKKPIKNQANIEQSGLFKRLKHWTEQQLQLLFSLYRINGPQWSKLAQNFVDKNQHNLKNKMNSLIRTATSILQYNYRKISKKSGKAISNKTIKSIMQFASQAQHFIEQKGLKKNQNCLLFRVRGKILNISQHNDIYTTQQIQDLLNQITKANKFLRSFNISKRKNLKGWSMNMETLRAYNANDHIFQEFFDQKKQSIIQYKEEYLQKQIGKMNQLKQNNTFYQIIVPVCWN